MPDPILESPIGLDKICLLGWVPTPLIGCFYHCTISRVVDQQDNTLKILEVKFNF